MKKIAIAIATIAAATLDYRAWTAPELLQHWMVLNEECRGGSGDEPATMRACDDRNLVDAALFAHGYCYVGMGATSRWEKGPASRWTHRGEQAICHR
jgi:hypothetical protein